MPSLKLDQPLLLLPGDRFILRQFSPLITIAGGRVLDNAEPRRTRAEERLRFLQTLLAASPQDALLARVSRRRAGGLTLSDAVAETGWTPARVAQLAGELQASGKLERFDHRLATTSVVEQERRRMRERVETFRRREPAGCRHRRGAAARDAWTCRPELFRGVLESLVRDRQLQVSGEQVHSVEALAGLRRERERQGLSLTDMAERTGIDRATISKLGTGKIANPTIGILRTYAKALGRRLAWTLEVVAKPDMASQ